MTVLGPLPKDVSTPRALIRRLRESAVVWSWIATASRLASGLILLPLVLNKLGRADLGMYYVLLSLVALVPLVDFGFGPTVGRFVSYAMGGARAIQAQGVAEPGPVGSPNYDLLWQLLGTTRRLYRYLSLLLLVVLGIWGTYIVELRINETSSILLTRSAWAVTLAAALFDIYSNWWVLFLRSMDHVMASARIAVLAMGVRLAVSAALFLAGAGLLSLPVGSFFGSLLQRTLARRLCHRLLAGHPQPANVEAAKLLRILWPNTWRLGVQFLSGYLTVNANTAICVHVLGLEANGQYGLSIQLLSILSGMASVWTSVKWPAIGKYRAQHDLASLQRVLWPRAWLQYLTFIVGAALLLGCGPWLLAHFGGGKKLLPFAWFSLMALGSFLDMQFTLWGTLIAMGNRLTYLWPTVATNVLSLVLSLTLIHFTSLGLGALVLGPILAGILFNYWYWPPYAAREVGTTFLKFLFAGPAHAAPSASVR